MRDDHCSMAASKRTIVIVAFAALYVIWGSTYLGIRFAIETIPPFLMAGARFVLAGLIMYAIAWSQGSLLRRSGCEGRIGKSSWANWRTSLIIGACLLLGGNGGVTISEQYIDSGLAALVVAIVPIYIVLLGWATGMAPRPAPIMWMGLTGGFLGVGILFGPGLHLHSVGGRNPAIGISILLVTTFIWSAGSLYSRVAKHAPSPFLTAAQQMICGGILLLVAGVATGELPQFHPSSISMLSLFSFIYLVLIGAVVGYTAYIWLLRHCEPAKVATYAYVNPIVAVLLGTLFAGETLTLRMLIAAILIIGSVALIITAQQLRARVEPALSTALEPAD
jgi:drug/metabolite transporter (DMT)-like permease